VVICASDALLQIWHVTGSTCLFSLNIEISGFSFIFLVPDGLTAVISYYGIYFWNHDTAQFHFTDQEHLNVYHHVYSPDGKLFACYSLKNRHVWVWDTWTGQFCGKPITMLNDMDSMALLPALNHQSLGNRLIAIHCWYNSRIPYLNINQSSWALITL